MNSSPVLLPPTKNEKFIFLSVIAGILLCCTVISFNLYSLQIPHNDSWAHSKIAQNLAQTGNIQLVNFNRASLIGMIFPVALLGGSVIVGNLFSTFCALLITYWIYLLCRENGGRYWSFTGILLLLFLPGFLLLSTSFMSDIPMLTGIVGCLYFAQNYTQNFKKSSLFLSLVLGLWGATVREQAIAVLAAVAIALWIHRTHRKIAYMYGVIGVTLFIIFEWWRRSLPYDDPPEASFDFGYGIRAAIMFVIIVGFVAFPLLLPSFLQNKYSPQQLVLMLLLSVPSLLLVVKAKSGALIGNYIAVKGAYFGQVLGDRPGIPDGILGVVACIGALMSGPFIYVLMSQYRKSNRIFVIFIVVYFAGTVAQSITGQGVFDRYMIPVFAVALPLLVANNSQVQEEKRTLKIQKLGGAVCTVALAAVSSAIFLEASASQGALWATAERVSVEKNIDAKNIDAGWNWVGIHSDDYVGSREVPEGTLGEFQHFTDSRQCMVLGFEGAGLEEVAGSYRQYGYFGRERDIEMKTVNPCK